MQDSTKRVRLLALIILVCMVAGAFVMAQSRAGASGATAGPLYLPILFNRTDGTLPEAPGFGVQMYNNTRADSQYISDLIDSNASWLRVATLWRMAEPENTTPANYNWDAVDRPFAAANRDVWGGKVIGTIQQAPDWAAQKPDGPLNGANYLDFAEFVRAVVERYDGDGIDDAPGSPVINYWEFYNEPDATFNTNFGRWGEYGAQYANMLATAYPAVKAANPHAKVLLGGLAYDWFQDQNGPYVRRFLDDVLKAGGGNYFDIMNFHSYPSFAKSWAPHGPGLLEKTQHLRNLLQSYGYDKPFMVTEAGWHSDNPPNFPGSEEIQSRYVVELFVQSFAADVDVMIWWMLNDPGGFAYDNGLVTNDEPPRRKQAFKAFQTIVNELGTAHFVRAFSDAETGSPRLEAYLFTDNVLNRNVLVAWLDPIDTTETKTLTLTATRATVRDIYGSSYTLTDAGDGRVDGKILLPVSGQPVYVETSK